MASVGFLSLSWRDINPRVDVSFMVLGPADCLELLDFLFLFFYAAYLSYLVLEAIGSNSLEWVEKGFFFVVLPLTLYYMFSRLIREGLAARRNAEHS